MDQREESNGKLDCFAVGGQTIHGAVLLENFLFLTVLSRQSDIEHPIVEKGLSTHLHIPGPVSSPLRHLFS